MRKTRHKCREEILAEYLDGTLEPKAKRQIELDILDCSTCRKSLEDLSATLNFADAVLSPETNALYYSSFLYKVRQRIEEREAITGILNWRSGLLGSLGLTAFFIWNFAVSNTTPTKDALANLSSRDGHDLEVQTEIALLVDDYWLETASTDQLLNEVGSFGGSQYADLLAGY